MTLPGERTERLQDEVADMKARLTVTAKASADLREELEQALAREKVLREALKETRITMRHAEVFISSREKMHPDGQSLYAQNLEQIDAALSATDPGNS